MAGILGVEVMVMMGQISGEDAKKGEWTGQLSLQRQRSVVT